jgi:hypothetical protein
MTRVSTSVGLVLLAAAVWVVSGAAQGQGQDHPFWDHSDTGEIIHVLPPQAAILAPHDTGPTLAPPSRGTAVYPASYGSGNLLNHGGAQIPGAGFWAVYWNAQVSESTETSLGYATLKSQIDTFILNYSDGSNWDNSATDDYTIVQQYGAANPIAPTLTNWGYFVDNQPTARTIKDSAIRSYLASLFNAGKLPASSSIVYGVYFPPGMKVSLQGGQSCARFCGYHGNFTYNGQDIKYASFPYLNCPACSLSGLSVADMMTIVSSHEIREAVTDPDLNAWYDAAGYEADDKCAWHNLYQITGTSHGGFWVQPEYSNGGTVTRSGFTATYPGPGCVVPNK